MNVQDKSIVIVLAILFSSIFGALSGIERRSTDSSRCYY